MRGFQRTTTTWHEQNTKLRGKPKITKHLKDFHPLDKSSAYQAASQGKTVQQACHSSQIRLDSHKREVLSYSKCETRSLKALGQAVGFPVKKAPQEGHRIVPSLESQGTPN